MEPRDIVVLPDYLPSRFNSWLEFYIRLETAMRGRVYNDETIVDWGEFDSDFIGATFIQKFKVGDVKAKAFDYIMTLLPEKEDMISLMYQFRSSCNPHGHSIDKATTIFNNLVSISK